MTIIMMEIKYNRTIRSGDCRYCCQECYQSWYFTLV